MKVELDREDLINLIKGTEPTHELMEHPSIKQLGTYTGGMDDDWSWGRNESFDHLNNAQLLKLYYLLKMRITI